jgi:hypothetical protein
MVVPAINKLIKRSIKTRKALPAVRAFSFLYGREAILSPQKQTKAALAENFFC